VLGYSRPADGGDGYTFSREKHVEVDGKFADAVLGRFGRHDDFVVKVAGTLRCAVAADDDFVVALEGKGPKDPLDRPFAGRRMSAVDQGYPSARPTNTATPTIRGRSGTTSAACLAPSTSATPRWASTATTADCSPTIRSWNA